MVDLPDAEFIDSMSIGAICAASTESAQSRVTLVAKTDNLIRSVLNLAGVGAVVPMYETREGAVHAPLGKSPGRAGILR